MNGMVRSSSGGLGSGTYALMGGATHEYTKTFKAAAAKRADLAWLPEAFDLFKRDVSKGTSFDEMFEQAKMTKAKREAAAYALTNQLVKGVHDGTLSLTKAGVTTALGYNYIDLRGPANLLYPVNTPLRDSISRNGKDGGGVGKMAQWESTRIVGSQYAGVPEGQRAPVSTPDQNAYAAPYKGIGVERNVTVEAEWAGEGFTGNLADEHIRGLQSLWLQEEGMLLLGNDGSGSLGQNGFQLGVAPAPVAALQAGGSLAVGVKLTAYVVLLTGMGNPTNGQYGYQPAPTPINGLVPQFTINAPGTGQSITYTGGMSAVSVASNSVTTAGGNLSASFTVQPASVIGGGGYPNGTFGFAWFISQNNAPTTSNAYITAVTQFGTYTVTSAPPVSGQVASAANLNVDNSAQSTDFTGLISWAATKGYWKDLQGAQLTSVAGGQVKEVEDALQYFFDTYQAGVDTIWGSSDAIKALQAAILANGGQIAGGQQIYLTQDKQNGVIGGTIVSAYMSRYAVNSPSGAGTISFRIHPMIPRGTLYFDIATNPYAGSRIPYTRAVLLMQDYYGYEWPSIQRAWAFGTYANETLAHYCPWLTGVITGIGHA